MTYDKSVEDVIGAHRLFVLRVAETIRFLCKVHQEVHAEIADELF